MTRMDEQEARRRILEGGFFVALGVPVGVEFGIDLKVHETGPQFKGVKMIPAGLHFVHYGTGEGEKQGFFFRSEAGSVAATQWDASAEDMVDAGTTLPPGAVEALRDSVRRLEMDAHLGPYPFDQRASWKNLTNCIADSVLERCGVPAGAKVLAGSSAGESGDEQAGAGAGAGPSPSTTELVPHFPHVGRVARFCELPDGGPRAETRGRGIAEDPREVTKRHMDRSAGLMDLVSSTFGGKWSELLGELQLAFVLFVSLSSLRGFRHWQALCALLCRCGDALATHPRLFIAFIRMLHAHLKLVPEDFFEAELSRDNFLVPCLSALMQSILPDPELSPALVDAAKRLLRFLRQRFGLFKSGVRSGTGHPSTVGRRSRVRAREGAGDADMDLDLDADVDEEGDGGSSDEDLVASGVRGRVGAAGAEAKLEEAAGAIMELELSEEDRPVVVPFEEVRRVLGGHAWDGMSPSQGDGDTDAPPTTQPVTGDSSSLGVEKKGSTDATPPSVPDRRGRMSPDPSVPSEEHSRRWRDIDRLLSERCSSSVRRPSCPSPATAAIPEEGTLGDADDADDMDDQHASQTKAEEPATREGYAASAAKRFPDLFASVGPMEDVMMAAARLVSDEGGYSEGVAGDVGGSAPSRRAAEEAVAFLEEVDRRPDGGAEAWMVPAVTDVAVRSSVSRFHP